MIIILTFLVWAYYMFADSLTDTKLWKTNPPEWLIKWFDLAWLGQAFLSPLVFSLTSMLLYIHFQSISVVLFYNLLIEIGMSVVWDLTFEKLENNDFFAPIPIWFRLPFITIGWKTRQSSYIIHFGRIVELIIVFYIMI